MKRTFPALLVGAASLLTLVGGPAPATARTPAPDAVSGDAVAESDLVRGIPDTPYVGEQRGTPDRKERTAEKSKPPRPAEPEWHVEYVPRSEVQRDGDGGNDGPPSCSPSTGPHQRQAERYLRQPVDGRQSAGDCEAIRRFQEAQHIEPATGFAGPVTGAVLRLLEAQQDPNRAGHCPNRPERVACVDLSRQLMWVQQGGKVIFRPVSIRSGRATRETRTGTYRIYYRNLNHTSSLYHSPMPFAQFFDRGEAVHGVYGDLYKLPGSHGCVNVKFADGEKLWQVLRNRDIVHVWGRKTGV
ncbi:L,D-transpeptidase [Streptomyces sp. NPDC050636]|uniref:L,D-transpeptidase family protein n=1 Tax=Streptomyces sp. NPDC050636 TaxID=3154510 RepID=UPI003424E50E